LNFLSDGDYVAEIYTDADDVRTNPNNLVKQIKNLKKTDNIVLQLATGGGAVVRFRKK